MNKSAAIPAPKSKLNNFFSNISLYDIIAAVATLAAAGGVLYLTLRETDTVKTDGGLFHFRCSRCGFRR